MKTLAILVSIGVGICASLGLSTMARADDGIPPAPRELDPADAANPLSIVSGAGIKVGEGTVFHPQIGIETGVVSNVFYEANAPITAGLLRILAEVGTGSLPNQRLARLSNDGPLAPDQAVTTPNGGDFQYSADLYATWEQYLSSNGDVTAQGGLGGGLLLRGIVNPQRAIQFAFQEHFSRVLRASNFESSRDANRDLNKLDIRLNYLPPGRALGGYLYYTNLIDVFEENALSNRMQNLLGLHVKWQWLPLTWVYADVSQGIFTGIGASDKVSSLPLTAVAGIQTALTLNTTLAASLGYANGFYASGPSYSSLVANVNFGYRYSPLGRIVGVYSYGNQDSINANFYRDHLFQATLEQYVVPFVLFVRPELRLRQYNGTLVMGTTGNTRDDVILGATVGMRYSFRDWIAGTLDYQLQSVQTDFKYNSGIGPGLTDLSYTRHELLIGVRAAY
jgi:hypothetical protein